MAPSSSERKQSIQLCSADLRRTAVIRSLSDSRTGAGIAARYGSSHGTAQATNRKLTPPSPVRARKVFSWREMPSSCGSLRRRTVRNSDSSFGPSTT